jgi:hypothetical protein
MLASEALAAARHPGHGKTIGPAGRVVQLALAYQAAHAVYVATRLGVPDHLGNGPQTADAIALRCSASPDRMRRLLRALAAFDVLNDLGADTFELTATGACLSTDAPESIRPLVLMYGSDNARQVFHGLEECVKTGRNGFEIAFGAATSFDYFDDRPELGRVFDDGMSAASALTGPAAAKAYAFDAVQHVVDVGGGHGGVIAAILRTHPHLRATLFDLPRVVAGTLALSAEKDVLGRCGMVAGDMFEAVPPGGDLYLLSHVIHNWDDAHATRILHSCRRAMSRGSRLLILDRVMQERIEPDRVTRGNVLIDLMMMARTPGGCERTAGEFESLLAAADFDLCRIIPMQISESLIEAVPA